MVSIYTLGEHASDGRSPRNDLLNTQQRSYCKDMAEDGLRPLRIRNGMRLKFRLWTDYVRSLQSENISVNNNARANMYNTDAYESINKLVHCQIFSGDEEETVLFTYDWKNDVEVKPTVLDDISSKALLRRLVRPPGTLVLHKYAAFKLNQVGYLMAVVLISNRFLSFHLVVLLVVSRGGKRCTPRG